MPTIQVEAEVSTRDLLRAVAQLSPTELEQFVTEVLALRAQRTSSGTPEPELLQRLRQVLPDEVRQRYRALIAKRRDGALTAEEQAELLRLTDEVEKGDAERVRVLGQIAQRRNQSLTDVMQDLGIQAPPYE